MSTNRPSDDLLARVLSGEGTPAERAVVESWASAHADAAAELEQLRTVWGKAEAGPGAWDVDRAWARVAPQLDASNSAPDIAPATRRGWPSWMQIAAAAVLVVGAVWGWRAFGPVAVTDVVYATAAGERKSVTLADGSTVVLAPRSNLVVSARYGRSARELTLSGEAWFSVVHDDARPFTVAADAFRVRVLGTVFTVRTQAGDTLGVSVVEGRVAVRRADGASSDETVMTAGDIGRFTTGGVAALVDSEQPVAALASWTAGDLALVDVAAADAVAAVARWHDTTISLADPSAARQLVTITLSLDSLDRALDDLALLLGLTVERVEGGFVLR